MTRFQPRFIRSLTVALAIALSASDALAIGARQEKDELFAGAEKFAATAKSSTEVNLDKRMLGMAAGFSGDDKTNRDLMNKLDFVIVRSYEYAKAGDYKATDVEEFTRRLDTGGWTHVVKERNEKESTDVCVKTDKEGQVSELVVISAEPKELTFVHLKGHLALDDLMKVGAKYGAPSDDAKTESKADPKLKKHEED